MHIPDGLRVDEEGERIVRAADAIMAAIPGTSFLEALHQIELAARAATANEVRASDLVVTNSLAPRETVHTSLASSGKPAPAAERFGVYYVTGGLAEPTRR